MKLYPAPKTGSHTGWSPGRSRSLQAKFRRIVLHHDNYTCRRCGRHDATGRSFEAHHLTAGYTVECGITLCDAHHGGCHKAWDRNAR